MAKIDDTDTKDTEVATEVATTDTANQMTFQFNAQTHVEHFREIFTEYYDIALSDWAKAAIADNTTTNRKACRLLGIPHVGCNNHNSIWILMSGLGWIMPFALHWNRSGIQ